MQQPRQMSMLQSIYILLKNNSFIDPIVINDWLRSENVLIRQFICATCNIPMTLIKDTKKVDKQRYRCKMCARSKTIRASTVFENSRFSMYEILQLIVLFVEDEYVKDVYQTGFYSKEKVVSFYKMLRQACGRYCDANFMQLGASSVVEIDETVISRRKYNRGRIVRTQWLFGCIERATNNFCLRLIDNRSRGELEEVIRECIIEDAVVYSDCWSSYMSLFANTDDYIHYSVNHSQYFVDPITGAHTQSIESLWARLKSSLRSKSYRDSQHLSDYLAEFTYRIKTQSQPKYLVFYNILLEITGLNRDAA